MTAPARSSSSTPTTRSRGAANIKTVEDEVFHVDIELAKELDEALAEVERGETVDAWEHLETARRKK